MQNTESNKKASAPVKRSKRASLNQVKARSGWFFILPFVLGFVIIYLPVVAESIYYSFTEIQMLKGGGMKAVWVGLYNYQEALFVNPTFVQTLTGSLQQLLFDIPAILIFSLFLAIMLNQKMWGRAAFRAIFFIPVILSTGLMDKIAQANTLMEYMGDTSRQIDTGVTQGADSLAVEIVSEMDFYFLFQNMRVGGDIVMYVVTAVNNIYNIVNRSGVQMLIFLSGLQAISPAIYESAFMEGASAWETFWKITFPMISPMILVNGVYTVIDSFLSKSNRVMSFIDGVYEQAGGPVLSAAMSWIYFSIVILAILLIAGIMSMFVFYQRREN